MSKVRPLFGDADADAVHVPSSLTPPGGGGNGAGAAGGGAAGGVGDGDAGSATPPSAPVSLAEGRAGRGRKRKPSALAQEALEARRPAASAEGSSGGATSSRGGKRGRPQQLSDASAQSGIDGAVSPGEVASALLRAVDGIGSAPATPLAGARATTPGATSGAAAAADSTAAAASAAPLSASSGSSRAYPVPHVLVSYTDVSAQCTSLYCLPVAALTPDESELLQSLHGAGATRNAVAQVVLERVLKKHGARMCPGAPLTHGKEFVMLSAEQLLAAGNSAHAAAMAATAAQAGVPATPATPGSTVHGQFPLSGGGSGDNVSNGLAPSLSATSAEKFVRRHRGGKGFHNFWIDRFIVAMYCISMVDASSGPPHAAAAAAAVASGSAAAAPAAASGGANVAAGSAATPASSTASNGAARGASDGADSGSGGGGGGRGGRPTLDDVLDGLQSAIEGAPTTPAVAHAPPTQTTPAPAQAEPAATSAPSPAEADADTPMQPAQA